MTLKNARKLGFFAALAMLVGSVVGVGIFFKNNSIQKVTDSQGITWLLAWVVGGVISLIVALNFSEISFLKPSKLNGLSNWLYRSGGKKLGYFTSFSYAFFYYPIIAMTLGVILSEVLVYFIGSAAGKDVSLPYYALFFNWFSVYSFIFSSKPIINKNIRMSRTYLNNLKVYSIAFCFNYRDCFGKFTFYKPKITKRLFKYHFWFK